MVKPSERYIKEDGYIDVRLKISKDTDREKTIWRITECLYERKELIEGVYVNNIYFKGNDVIKAVDDLKSNLIEKLTQIIKDENL